VDEEAEFAGLDESEHGEHAYNLQLSPIGTPVTRPVEQIDPVAPLGAPEHSLAFGIALHSDNSFIRIPRHGPLPRPRGVFIGLRLVYMSPGMIGCSPLRLKITRRRKRQQTDSPRRLREKSTYQRMNT